MSCEAEPVPSPKTHSYPACLFVYVSSAENLPCDKWAGTRPALFSSIRARA
jgi:hypothetical protein